MDLFVSNDEVAAMEAALILLHGPARLAALVPLAWHLRQRDTGRAMALVDEADTLLAQAALADEPRLKLVGRLLLVRGEARCLMAEMDAATGFVAAALRNFRAIGDQRGCADAHWLLAHISYECGNVAGCGEALTASSAVALEVGDHLRVDFSEIAFARFAVLGNLRFARVPLKGRVDTLTGRRHAAIAASLDDLKGHLAFHSSDFAQSIACRIPIVDSFLSVGQVRRAITAAMNVCSAFSNLNDQVTALEWAQRALDLARASGWLPTIGSCLCSTANVLRALGRLDSAQELLQEAFDKLSSVRDSHSYAIALRNLGNLSHERGDFSGALNAFRQMRTVAGSHHRVLFQIESLRGQAHALSALGQPDGALAQGSAALVLARAHGDAFTLIKSLTVLAEIHSRHVLPAPDNLVADTAALHYLNQILDVAVSIDGYTLPADILNAIAGEYAKSGNHERAYAFALQAVAAHDKTHSEKAANRTIAFEVRDQTARADAESEYHRQLAARESQRAILLAETSATLEILGAIGQEITAQLNTADVFQDLSRHVCRLLDATGLTVYLRDLVGDGLHQEFGINAGKSAPTGAIGLAGLDSYALQCAHERRQIVVRQPPDPKGSRVPGMAAPASAMFAPLLIGDRVLGVLTVQSPQEDAYGEREQLIFRTLCAYGAIALDNANTYQELEASLQAVGKIQAELVEKNIELDRANRVQEERQRELTRFLAIASHDLRQPMHALTLYLATLKNFDLPVSARPMLDSILHCAQITDSMFVELLDLSRLDALVVQPHTECFPIASILSRLTEEFELHAVGKGLEFQVEPSCALVESDAVLIEQILRNFISNAVRYTDTGKIVIRCTDAGRFLRVAVHDTGIGIAPDRQISVFDEFHQASDGREGVRGLGLGLAIVRRLGVLLDVPVTLVSTPGQGSMFAIDLPQVRLQPVGSTPTNDNSASGAALAGKLIVVIDDEETILDAMGILLQQWGCTVITAVSSDDAVAKLTRCDRLPDALISDYRLRHDENGWDVIRILRGKLNREIPSLLVTGESAPADIRQVVSTGIPVLHKPVQPEALRDALVTLVQDRK